MSAAEELPEFIVDQESLITVTQDPGTYRFLVGPASQLSLEHTDTENTEIRMILTDPDGRHLDPSALPNDPSVRSEKEEHQPFGSFITTPPRMFDHRLLIDNPAPGSWMLQLESTAFLKITLRDPLGTLAVPRVHWSRPGKPSYAMIKLEQDGQPILGATVKGSLVDYKGNMEFPFVSEWPLSFLDHGSEGDQRADDGIYTALINMDHRGHQFIKVHATNGRQFERIAGFPLNVSEQGVRFTNRVKELAKDTDRNGKSEFLYIRVGVEVLDPQGNYRLCGDITDFEGYMLSKPGSPRGKYWAVHKDLPCLPSPLGSSGPLGPRQSVEIPHVVGHHEVELSFSGKRFLEGQRDGPYQLWVQLEDEDVGDVAFGRSTYQTKKYQWKDFEVGWEVP